MHFDAVLAQIERDGAITSVDVDVNEIPKGLPLKSAFCSHQYSTGKIYGQRLAATLVTGAGTVAPPFAALRTTVGPLSLSAMMLAAARSNSTSFWSCSICCSFSRISSLMSFILRNVGNFF